LDNLLHTPKTAFDGVVKWTQHIYDRGTSAASCGTESWNKRFDKTCHGDEVEIIVPFNVDLGSTNKFFPPGTNVKITITLNEPDFYLVKHQAEDNNHRLVIDEIYLQTTKATILPYITEAHQAQFKSENAVYPIRHVKQSERVILKDTTSTEFDLFMSGQVPYNITLLFLPFTTWSGDPTKEPLFFERHGLSSASLVSETKSIDYDYTKLLSAYCETVISLNEKDVDVGYEAFVGGGLFFVHFDLTDGTPENALRQVYRTNLRLSLKWKKPTTTALTLLVIYESVGHLEINSVNESTLILR